MRTDKRFCFPATFDQLSEHQMKVLASLSGQEVETTRIIFNGLASAAFTYLLSAVEEEGDLTNRLIGWGVSAELAGVIEQIETLNKSVSKLSPADWNTLKLLDEAASRSGRDEWRDNALCLNLDVVDFFDAFWMRTLELSQFRDGIKKGRGRRVIRTESFDLLGDTLVKLWIETTLTSPTWTRNRAGLLTFVNLATEYLTGSVSLTRFSGPARKKNPEGVQTHYLIRRTMLERQPTIREAAKAGLKRWKAAQVEIK